MNWHERFKIQANWTKNLRLFLYRQIGIKNTSSILEVGSGTGVITEELSTLTSVRPVGVDLLFDRNSVAQENTKRCDFACGDAYQLPFQ